MSLAKPRKLLLCLNGLSEVVEEACRMGIEIPVIVLGTVEGGEARGYLHVVGCNEADDRSTRFRIDAHSLYRAVAIGRELGLYIVAVVHNHLHGAPQPSPHDLKGMEMWPTAWVIHSCNDGVAAWVPETVGSTVEIREIELELVESCGIVIHRC